MADMSRYPTPPPLGEISTPEGHRYATEDGKPKIWASISDGFHATFHHKRFWLVLGLLLVLLNAAMNIFTGTITDKSGSDQSLLSNTAQFITGVVVYTISLFLYKSALDHIDGKKPTFRVLTLPPHVFQVIAVGIIPTAVAGLVAYGAAMINAPTAVTITVLLALVVAMPLYTLAPWLLTDDKVKTIKNAFVVAFRLGIKNYWRIVGFSITFGIVAIAFVIVTIGIGAIVIAPLTYLATASMYRRISNAYIEQAVNQPEQA